MKSFTSGFGTGAAVIATISLAAGLTFGLIGIALGGPLGVSLMMTKAALGMVSSIVIATGVGYVALDKPRRFGLGIAAAGACGAMAMLGAHMAEKELTKPSSTATRSLDNPQTALSESFTVSCARGEVIYQQQDTQGRTIGATCRPAA